MNYEKIHTFRDLIVWQEAHKLVLGIYEKTAQFPRHDLYGLVSQIRRCSISISSNIAEGFSRQYYKEKIQFYLISKGSLTELQNQLIIAMDVGYIQEDSFTKLYKQSIIVIQLLNGIIRKSRIIQNS